MKHSSFLSKNGEAVHALASGSHRPLRRRTSEKKERGVVNAHRDAADLQAAIKEEQLCLLLISSDEHSTASLPFISAARPAA